MDSAWFSDTFRDFASGAALFAVSWIFATKKSMGERVGKIEQYMDFERGRREGRAEAQREIGRKDEQR